MRDDVTTSRDADNAPGSSAYSDNNEAAQAVSQPTQADAATPDLSPPSRHNLRSRKRGFFRRIYKTTANKMYIMWMLTLAVTSLVSGQVYISEIPHGIIAINQGEVEIVEGYWRLYVILEETDLPHMSALDAEVTGAVVTKP
jgi:hypothetical protein